MTVDHACDVVDGQGCMTLYTVVDGSARTRYLDTLADEKGVAAVVFVSSAPPGPQSAPDSLLLDECLAQRA
ncbi:hypothetical protein ACFYSW_12195 [Rhodococcus aetherivorans]|uniref:hypothetical protein n=1 Tax=Rhodococcus aetherivorans TaxID=191292 RepID=UPI003685FE10